jgi:hypothetical protein
MGGSAEGARLGGGLRDLPRDRPSSVVAALVGLNTSGLTAAIIELVAGRGWNGVSDGHRASLGSELVRAVHLVALHRLVGIRYRRYPRLADKPQLTGA